MFLCSRTTISYKPRYIERRGYALSPQSMLTARAASNTTMVKEIVAWSIMSSLAHGERTGASVGDKAVLVISFAIFHPCGVFNR